MFNTRDNYKEITVFKATTVGIQEEEINAVLYLTEKIENKSHPFLIVGGLTGGLTVFDVN
jgi:hypothetical protein